MEPGRELLRSNDRLNNSVSSARYAAAVWLVCDRLEMIVGWQALCQLATAKSWREWVSSLPAAQRQLVATEIPTGGTDGVRE
jgi:hypothetical protein